MGHLFRFGGKPAGLLYGAKQGEGAVHPEQTEIKILELLVTTDGGGSEILPTWLSCSGKEVEETTDGTYGECEEGIRHLSTET